MTHLRLVGSLERAGSAERRGHAAVEHGGDTLARWKVRYPGAVLLVEVMPGTWSATAGDAGLVARIIGTAATRSSDTAVDTVTMTTADAHTAAHELAAHHGRRCVLISATRTRKGADHGR